MSRAKPFLISKHDVFEAYRKVKANKGSGGVDNVSMEEFELNLKDNLYKIWNRMSSGTYFPPPVKTVEIPKSDGKMRKLGIPTIADRIAQTVVKMVLEPILDPLFHYDSYAYRPKKTMKQALTVTRERCWKKDWVIDLDIKGFFDNMDHELTMKAVIKHTDSKWILMYIERWLKAPAQDSEGTLTPRDRGVPQGGSISPLLSNLFMHYALDEWLRIKYPEIQFARFADDVVIHCSTKEEAQSLLKHIIERLKQCKLDVHPEKTKIVYCKDDKRGGGGNTNVQFDFLGYTFRARATRAGKGNLFTGFNPAISAKATKRIKERVRELKLVSRTTQTLEEIGAELNPIVRGWINHYGIFNRSVLDQILDCVNEAIAKWAIKKYKTLKKSYKRAYGWIARIKTRDPLLFAHW